MLKPKLLDLFCGGGGCTKGYQRAGFYVVGVDNKPHPNYCGDEFFQADAMTFPLDGFDVIHASPPCQAFTVAQVIHGNDHIDLLTPTRKRLIAQGTPWVIENVPGAPMRIDLMLCGSMFPPLRVRRHRWFEFSDPTIAPLTPPCDHSKARPIVSVFGHGGHIYHGVEDWKDAMGIDWMKRDEIAQAIPPAYTEFIGNLLIEAMTETSLV